MLRLAYEHQKLLRLLVIHKLKEAAPRPGFFGSIAYAFGWRMQSEMPTLQRRQLHLKAGTLRLEPGQTRNDDGRIVYLPESYSESLAVSSPGSFRSVAMLDSRASDADAWP